ncbi:DUF7824 domain-containing protein [Streptomyces brasiliensis]|uniref:DUF7824 domain-containing protein n=1 Tax=Streptomyces brasiliensis TaxID=1954 RepID=A0A917P222_9ACTN|nr:DUF6493 family protein [Streptomyces brasiliensis]GGJ53321.1 hypothetical protein GCM10010121_075150 [Streptomyces brasiliensis]
MSALIEAVRAGRTDETLRLLEGMTDAGRRAALPELKALRKEMRGAPWGNFRTAYPALHAAGAACHTGAAAAANWLAAADLRWWQASPEVLLRALAGRDNAWLADVARRLAQRPVSANVSYELMSGLVRRAGCEVPVTDAYVTGWVRHIGSRWRHGSVLERLRAEPDLAPLVTGLFELSDLGEVRWTLGDGPWHDALAELTRAGSLDRKAVLDACVARLLRGGGPTDHRAFLPLLVRLELTRAEERERVADWTALARDAASPVAAHAQSVLGALALSEELTPRQLAEASEGVLFRGEKKLVRAQLVLLGKALSRDPSAAPDLLPAVARAFGHEDTQVQERALKLVERHTKRLTSEDVRTELSYSAEQLIPPLRIRAKRTLGIEVADPVPAVHEEVLPPVPEPVRLAAAPETVVELAEEVAALLASEGDVATFERALDGLVRHAYSDAHGLLDALDPVIKRRWWDASEPGRWRHADTYFSPMHHHLQSAHDALDLLLATLRGRVGTSTLHTVVGRHASTGHGCVHRGLATAFDARIREVAYRLRTDPLPLLLSTPTTGTGLLEPGELVDRLDTYRRLGARVSAADFAQALLRVRRGDRTEAAAAAERANALGTREGERLAHWLRSQGTVLPLSRRRTRGSRIVVEFGELLEFQEDFPADFRTLGRPVGAFAESRYCSHWSPEIRQHWLAVLPERRELVAVRMVHDLAHAAEYDTRGAAGALPQLAESGGEAGECVHLCVAYGLGARHPEDRLAAVDALLVLAARGQLDPARLGADLGQLVRRGVVKPLRLAESARTAAATGANATIWGMLRHTLPVLLADLATAGPAGAIGPTGRSGPSIPARGLGDLLAVADECAERSGARGELPHLSHAADRRGSSRLVTQARRLRDALAVPVAA